MFRALVLQLLRRIDHEHTPYIEIAAGVVYLVAFNTALLRVLHIPYFGFVLLVAVLCLPFLLRRPEPTRYKQPRGDCARSEARGLN
jgi:hypothetical protein